MTEYLTVKRIKTSQAWCEVGGKRFYSRSKWERNYARYLEWLKQSGEIHDWDYEPKTFWFDKIKRGVVSYKPDFVMWGLNYEAEYYEVKGYMDPKSRTKLKRMAKYYPDVTVIVIDKPRMAAIAKWKKLIPGWED